MTTRRSIRLTMQYRRSLSLPSDCLAGVAKWIRRCEWKMGGFSQTPANTPIILTRSTEGSLFMRAVNERPHYPQEITRLSASSRTPKAGFGGCRFRHLSLESAYYALKALVQLSYWKR